MSILDVDISETILFYEYCQGNSFNGLEYDDTIEDGFGLYHDVYHVWNDLLEDSMGLEAAFTPYHYMVIGERLSLGEEFGLPIRVSATNLAVIHEQRIRQVDIAFFGLEVLHGVDIFWEEVSSAWHATEYTQGVPYYWFDNIDYLGLDVNSTVVKVNFAQSLDRLNMRHNVDQTYDFNNIIQDRFFIYDWPNIGWGKTAKDSMLFADTAARAIGFSLYEYLFPQSVADSKFVGDHVIRDNAFIWDKSQQVKGYSDTLEVIFDLSDIMSAPYFGRLVSGLDICDDLELTNTITSLALAETIKAISTVAVCLNIAFGVNDVLTMLDEFTLSALVRDYVDTIEDGFNLSAETASNFIIFRVIEDALSGEDTALMKLFINETIDDESNFEGSMN